MVSVENKTVLFLKMTINSRDVSGVSLKPLISNITLQILLFLLPHITYSRDGENFLIYQRNSCWVIISLVLMTSVIERALILQ